jgi:cytochrome P450
MNSTIFTLENIRNPYPEYRRLREETPVWWSDMENRWVLTRHKDIHLVLSDDRFSVARQMTKFKQLSDEERQSLATLRKFQDHDDTAWKADFPKHTRLKKVEVASFTHKSIEQIKPFITDLCNQLIDEVLERSKMDIVADYAAPIALRTIAEYLGFPASDIYMIREWTKRGTAVRAMVGKYKAAIRYQETTREIRTYITKLIADFRRENRPGLIGQFIKMYDQKKLHTEDELFWTIYTMIGAGHHTTLNTIANGILVLLQHPVQLEMMRTQPGLVPTMVEEVLRYESYVQFLDRVAIEDIEIAGQHIRKGDVVAVCVGAANRDTEVFDRPDELDITRHPNNHLSFGYSTHYCSGAGLAKYELGIAFSTLFDRIPNIQLKDPVPDWGDSLAHRFLKQLPITWE